MQDFPSLPPVTSGHPLLRHLAASAVPGRPQPVLGEAAGVFYNYWGETDLAVVGPDADAAALVLSLGDSLDVPTSLPAGAAALLPEGYLADPHGWSFRWTTGSTGAAPDAAYWLADGERADLDALLAVAFPDASTGPDSPRAKRWAGIRDDGGRLAACAVDSTGVPDVGFVASIAVHPECRGRGLGRLITGWMLDQLVAQHGCAALWAYGGNAAARAVYDKLGMEGLELVSGGPPAAMAAKSAADG